MSLSCQAEVNALKKQRPSIAYNTGRNDMNTNQLERLRKDSRETGHYIQKLIKKGRMDKVRAMQIKQNYIESEIAELEQLYLQTA